MKTNHMPWDDGAISFGVLAPYVGQKTVKAMCGKRVKMSDAQPSQPTACEACNKQLAERQEAIEAMNAEMARLGIPGYKAE